MERLMGVRLGTALQDAGQSSFPITHSEEKLLSQSQKMPCLRGKTFKLIFCLIVIKGLLTQLPQHLWEEPGCIVSARFLEVEVDNNAVLPPALSKAEKSHFLSLLSYVVCPRLLIILVASAGLIHMFLLGSAAMDTALRVLPLPC